MVTRFASRFGFAPRPNQTVYEYAGVLAELLPDARPELETVARAKVEVAYGGRRLGRRPTGVLREAQRRLRASLLRLAFRRADRRRRAAGRTRRLERAAPAARFLGGDRLLVEERREVAGQVVRAQDGPGPPGTRRP